MSSTAQKPGGNVQGDLRITVRPSSNTAQRWWWRVEQFWEHAAMPWGGLHSDGRDSGFADTKEEALDLARVAASEYRINEKRKAEERAFADSQEIVEYV